MTKIISWVVVIALIIGGVWWWQSHKSAPVEVTPTPTPTETGPSTKTYTDPTNGVSYVYPTSLPTKYITAIDWPPKVQVLGKKLSCTVAGSATSTAGATMKRTINGTPYCVTTETEGAAGSIYNNYAYAMENGGKTYIFTFSTRSVQCANYDDPQKTECEQERASFNIDNVIDSIVRSAFPSAS